MRMFFIWSSLSASPQQERFLNYSNSTRFSKKDYPSCWVVAESEDQSALLSGLEAKPEADIYVFAIKHSDFSNYAA